MAKEYKDSVREGFEVYIAKQLRLETISKAVLAVQVFAMKGQEYADKKLQINWGEWEAACSQQIAKDVVILTKEYLLSGHAPTGVFKDACIGALRNQEVE